MAIRIALFAVPAVAVAGLVLFLNGVNAGAGIAVAALGVLAVATGATLGYFADRLPVTLSELAFRRFQVALEGDGRYPQGAIFVDAH